MSWILKRDDAMSSSKSRWIRPNRVAERLDCTRQHVYDLVAAGQLEAVRLGPRAMRISEISLEGYIEKMRISSTEKI